jgi:hypothetical protein
MLDTAAARVSRTSSRVMGLTVDFTGDGVSPLDDTMSSPASIQQGHSGKSSTRKPRQKDVAEVVTVSDANIDDVLLTIDQASPGRTAVEPGVLNFDVGSGGGSGIPADVSPEKVRVPCVLCGCCPQVVVLCSLRSQALTCLVVTTQRLIKLFQTPRDRKPARLRPAAVQATGTIGTQIPNRRQSRLLLTEVALLVQWTLFV